jgi:hypothetical protein
MWWRLGILGAVTASLLILLFAPIATVSVTVDLPPLPPASHAIPSAGQVETVSSVVILIAEAGLVVVILAVATWIGWRIVRRHRS